MCPFCNETENEVHFMFYCSAYDGTREKYLSRYLQKNNSDYMPRADWAAVAFLVNGRGTEKTRNVAMYIYYSLQIRTVKMKEMANCDQNHIDL